LTFGDITKDVNVFNLERQRRDINDQTFEVNLIENLTSEHEENMEIDTEAEFDLESEDFNLDQIVDSAVDWAPAQVYLMTGMKVQILPPMKQHLPQS